MLRLIKKRKNEKRIILRNYFKTNFEKTALISYLTAPFKQDISKSFHNYILENKLIAQTINQLGYNIDIVDYNFEFDTSKSSYDLIFGFGKTLDKHLTSNKSKSCKTILYSTGCNPIWSNEKTIKRLNEFYSRHNSLAIKSHRFVEYIPIQQIISCDRIVTLGNNAVADTYRNFTSVPIDYINGPAYKIENFEIEKSYQNAKLNFLFFSGSGAVHKGLDICLDYFLNNSNIHLHVCGSQIYEEGFWNYYQRKVVQAPNIHVYGYMDIHSEKFRKLLNACCFIISPSVSEGQSTSLVNTIYNSGMIPITTKISGLPHEVINSIVIDKPKENDFAISMQKALNLSNQLVEKYTQENLNRAEIFSEVNFKNALTKCIQKTI